ncbi:MAG: ABC transporter substrate-binding protein [Chloroflexi bacterium]|nr:ABC transporter substrate-binding protein [Chloroflexota bacterium]
MKRKVIWLVVSGWMVAALLLSACAPAVVEEEKVVPKEEVVTPREEVVPKEVVAPKEVTNLVKWTGTKLDGTVVEKMLEKPKYGGTVTYTSNLQPVGFDAIAIPGISGGTHWHVDPINEDLLIRDLTRGQGGTGEWNGFQSFLIPAHETGLLAENWERPDDSTIIWHIRQGVHWGLDPTSEASRLMGGRELTAADVVFQLIRDYGGGYIKTRAPYLRDMKNPANSIYVSPTDKWAVVIKVQPEGAGLVWETSAEKSAVQPREVVEKYGDMTNWRNVVGTGPFMLKEYISASSLTYVRNPNYWMKDPFFPDNQLPYIDTLKLLIIPDLSTMTAALRTGKVDTLVGVDLGEEDTQPLIKSNPEMKWQTSVGTAPVIYMRNDTRPFDDLRVRRALFMAINFRDMVDQYYGGAADLNVYPISPAPGWEDTYVPLEQMPESVRELYEYHPDKAKQLLAEAGYPQGFKTEILARAIDVDVLSIIKDYWAKIGVDLKLDVRETTVYTSVRNRQTYTQMVMYQAGSGVPFAFNYERAGQRFNNSIINDPRLEAAIKEMDAAYFDEPKKRQIMKDIVPYRKEQAWLIDLPTAREYYIWQPWLKNYFGPAGGGYSNSLSSPRYVWIDQELKKAMGR